MCTYGVIEPPRPDSPEIELPETLSYRIKNKLLGPPLVTESLSKEKLGKFMALGVLSSDCISSSAYGTEEILLVLVKAVGLAAFSLLIPITIVVLVVLAFVTLSYLEVVQVYTKAGGAYTVARENFGLNVAQIAGVALIIDYTVTVAVQTAAGADALASAFPGLTSYKLIITLVAVLVLAYGNLRGLREAGRIFAFPTYFFIGSMGLVIVVGLIREVLGQLHHRSLSTPGIVPLGHSGQGLLLGASLFVVLQAFANGGSSLTGLEAVSNGVGAIKDPAGLNAKKVMLVMSITLGSLVLGVSWLAHVTHAIPFTAGSPTVISQVAKAAFGTSALGTTLFLMVQAATVLILFTGANTSFNGFPFLTSFVATDSFLPRQLSRRGHRLAFSNGIIVLTLVSLVLLLVTKAKVDKLVSLYAIGVFTGFTMAGAGMVKYHLTQREPHWRRKIFINGAASVLSALVVLIFAVVKFTEGAWVVVVVGPILVFTFIRLHHQYEVEADELQQGAPRATEVAILRRHVVMVMVEKLDLASARAIQYARTLQPDELHAVHFILDTGAARQLEQEWGNLGLSSRFDLELEECPDRRIGRATLQKVAVYVAGGETEVSVLLPRRAYTRSWSRFLHDRTADRIAAVVSQLPHANATIVPFHLGKAATDEKRLAAELSIPSGEEGGPSDPLRRPSPTVASQQKGAAEKAVLDRLSADVPAAEGGPRDRTPISQLKYREVARVAGRVKSVRVQPWSGIPSLECTLVDTTGGIALVFLGRRKVAGISPGVRMVVEARVGEQGGRLAMLNPIYQLVAADEIPPSG